MNNRTNAMVFSENYEKKNYKQLLESCKIEGIVLHALILNHKYFYIIQSVTNFLTGLLYILLTLRRPVFV